MNTFYQYQVDKLRRITLQEIGQYIGKYWFKGILAGLVLYAFLAKDISISVNMQSKGNGPYSGQSALPATFPGEDTQMGYWLSAAPSKPEKQLWPSDKPLGNLSLILHPEMIDKYEFPEGLVEQKMKKCRKYIKQYAEVAIKEMKQFNIPASITLAQALLESNVGESRLSTESKNHFGIKCRTKCKGCTCRNYEDDDEYDMFRVFDSAWESFREHSKLLDYKRYRHLKKLNGKDYRSWARGLKKAGYATDEQYAEKLIRIIEGLELYRFDQI